MPNPISTAVQDDIPNSTSRDGMVGAVRSDSKLVPQAGQNRAFGGRIAAHARQREIVMIEGLSGWRRPAGG